MAIDNTPTTPTTLLDAINILLSGIKVSRIASLLQINRNEDAGAAKETLDTVAREVQMVGYEFNTERGRKIDPDVNGEISIPVNTLRVISSRCSSGNRLVQRGGRLFDTKKLTYNVAATVEVDLVVALPFDELPMSAKSYVTAVAARRFCVPRLPDGATFRYTEEMVGSALAIMQQEDTDVQGSDLKETSPHFGRMGRR